MLSELAKLILKVTLFSCTLEIDAQIICKKLEVLAEIVLIVPEGCFSEKEINTSYKGILQLLKKAKI